MNNKEKAYACVVHDWGEVIPRKTVGTETSNHKVSTAMISNTGTTADVDP